MAFTNNDFNLLNLVETATGGTGEGGTGPRGPAGPTGLPGRRNPRRLRSAHPPRKRGALGVGARAIKTKAAAGRNRRRLFPV
jgi:hypothetical protein